MRLVWFTNIPSPYRVIFFNELNRFFDLKVIFERKSSSERNKNWQQNNTIEFECKYLWGLKYGKDKLLPLIIPRELFSQNTKIIISNPFTATGIIFLFVLKILRKKWIIEGDGGNYKETENYLKHYFKKWLLKGADHYFYTGKNHEKYYKKYGIQNKKLRWYPFTSIYNKDILKVENLVDKKIKAKTKLGFQQKTVLLFVGRFIQQKGLDTVFSIISNLDNNYILLMVGGLQRDLKRYKDYLESNQDKIQVLGFKDKNNLDYIYTASDILIFPTHHDVWGLVINEALAKGTQVITSDKAGASFDLINDGVNGFIAKTDKYEEYIKYILKINNRSQITNATNAIYSIKNHTIENMVLSHKRYFEVEQ